MGEVIYNLNGKYFRDSNIFISDSEGLFDELKPKSRTSYDWKERHGKAIDFSEKPKYESREITLSGWVEGTDWKTMLANFKNITKEFKKSGKQRLTIEPFGMTTLVYDVICEDDISLKKVFNDGRMVGEFNMKLIETSPIKKILYIAGTSLNLAFNSPDWVEINIDGVIEFQKGTVNLTKTLTNRTLSGYAYEGRNLLKNTTFNSGLDGWIKWNVSANVTTSVESGKVTTGEKNIKIITQGADGNCGVYVKPTLNVDNLKTGDVYTLSGYYKTDSALNSAGKFCVRYEKSTEIKRIFPIDPTKWNKFEVQISINTAASSNSALLIYSEATGQDVIYLYGLKFEKGNKATDWTPAPEDQHFISISGNIEEITGLTTNAEILWEEL